MSKIVNTSVIYGNIKVSYDYFILEPLKTLNPMGNFYRSNHLHKKTQKFMENYLKNGNVPKVGEKVISDCLFSDLKITNICFEYKRNEGENFLKNLEDKFLKEKQKLNR